MNQESIDKLRALIKDIPITHENRKDIKNLEELLDDGDFAAVLQKVKIMNLTSGLSRNNVKSKNEYDDESENEQDNKEYDDDEVEQELMDEQKKANEQEFYPKQLSNLELEHIYIGLLLENPKGIVKYYFLYEDTFFEDKEMLNIYKSVLFTEGGNYTSEKAKSGFNFATTTEAMYKQKYELKQYVDGKNYDMEKVYTELLKLFILRRSYTEIPIKSIQDKIVEIATYQLYDKMSVEEVKSAINQVTVTGKFKQAVLNKNLTNFLEAGSNNLTDGLRMPFPILNSVFKGIRKGETMAYAMPSNSGKSRFTINIAAYTAFVHKKKVLVISNEMSEEKMKLCLITTILNDPDIQKLHGQVISKTEGELLEFKFRPDDSSKVDVDEDGFVIKGENESQRDFVKRLSTVSTEFNQTIEVTNWVNKQLNNSIYFINITDHTNEELQKVIINYYYKEKIEYVFYDTLKTDTANIGIGEEIKRTATILSNIAQNFEIFIYATLQLTESATLPINLTVNDLSVSRTIKEVLDTLCLIKQINRDNYDDYEYSLEEVDTKFYNLERFKDPDVRYYACVVDKNRAGAKPKLLFRLNLAYNRWEELGYLRLKQGKGNIDLD